MNLDIEGRTALVLCAGGGLGRAIALGLASERVNLAVADINASAMADVADAVERRGVKALALGWDLGDLSLVDSSISEIERALGAVDILINITGGPPPSNASGQTEQLWTNSFKSMVLSIIAVTDRVLPGMRERGWGRIVTSTSSGVVAPIPNLAISNSLRLSLLGWSKSLSREVAAQGITCNVVVPGRIATDRIRFLDSQTARREGLEVSEVERRSTSSIPLGRYAEPAEFADAVTFLSSERARYITGSVTRVDGGYIPALTDIATAAAGVSTGTE